MLEIVWDLNPNAVTNFQMLMCLFFQIASFLCDGIVESLQTYMNIVVPGVLMFLSHADRLMMLC